MKELIFVKENSAFKNLSDREWQVICLLNKGKGTKEIAHILNIKPNTVSTVKRNSFFKLNIKSNLELHRLSHQQGAINLDQHLKRIMKKLCNYFFNYDYELENVKDLKEYSFTDLEMTLLKINKRFIIIKETLENHDFEATFKSKKTTLVLMYTSFGVFKYKVKEEWLNIFQQTYISSLQFSNKFKKEVVNKKAD